MDKPLCTNKCTRRIQGARVKVCKALNYLELEDVHGTQYHEHCQRVGKYEEASNE